MERAAGKDAGLQPGLADHARQALSWWLGELASMVPNALRRRAVARPVAIHCALLADGRVAAGPAGIRPEDLAAASEPLEPGEALTARLEALAQGAPGRTVCLSVPRALCLVRRAQLPAKALAHAGAVLRHEAEALMPLEPGDILGDWYVETEDMAAKELRIVHVLLSRVRIRAVEESIAAAGLTLTRLTVGEAEGRPIPVDLLSRGEPSVRSAIMGLPPLAKLFWGSALLLLLATPFLAMQRQAAALDALVAARSATPKPTPASLSAAAVADFLDGQAKRPPLGLILDDLARRLPSGAALTQFHLEGERLTIGLSGIETDAAAKLLAASPYLSADPSPPASGILAFVLRARGASEGETETAAGAQP